MASKIRHMVSIDFVTILRLLMDKGMKWLILVSEGSPFFEPNIFLIFPTMKIGCREMAERADAGPVQRLTSSM